MRMEELSDNRYEKDTNSVEKYLLNIVQEYFKNQSISSAQSKETIIKRAVARMKEEIDFESIGVLSITMPDGEKRIGAVQISLEDLNGEPFIADKKTAFNVDFGDKPGTACEGNDSRLSDSRKPTKHTHAISDILNLDSELLAIMGKLNRLTLHDHDNINALDIIRYSGTKDSIDLVDVEKLQSNMNSLLSDVQAISDAYKKDTKAAVDNAQTAIQNAQQKFNQLQGQIDNQGEVYRLQLESTMDTSLADAYNQLNANFKNYATSKDVADLKQAVSNAITSYGSTTVSMADVIAAEGKYKVDDGIPVEIQSLGIDTQPVIDAYINIDGIRTKMPYFIFDDNLNTLDGSVSVVYDGQDVYITCNAKNALPDNLSKASIQIVYSVREV